MVGGLILDLCLNSSEIQTVTIITRKPTGIVHEKLTEVIHSDFTNFSTIDRYFENQDVAYFCLGVYTGTVDRNTFQTITVDYTQAFADTLKQKSPTSTFCF